MGRSPWLCSAAACINALYLRSDRVGEREDSGARLIRRAHICADGTSISVPIEHFSPEIMHPILKKINNKHLWRSRSCDSRARTASLAAETWRSTTSLRESAACSAARSAEALAADRFRFSALSSRKRENFKMVSWNSRSLISRIFSRLRSAASCAWRGSQSHLGPTR